jgi:6-phosphogluconolactonase (cycloisomerase 2 family)
MLSIRVVKTKLTRRALLSGCAAALASRCAGAQIRTTSLFAYVGCFTSAQRYARGDGIHVYSVDPETAAWGHIQQVGNLVNPSFLALGRGQRFLYSAHGDGDHATAFSVDRESGKIALLNRAETGGRNGVHLALDPAGRFLVTANYTSGSVSVIPIREDGTLAEAAQVTPLPGQPGPNRVEQASSHPHQIVFDPSGRFVVVPDKGLDRIFVFAFDAGAGKLTPTAQGSAVSRAGSGPRHAAFHPTLPVLWVVNEISSTIATYYWDSERGHLRPVQILPALPPDYTGENTSAEIAVSSRGRFVYCSNRGHDSIGIFAADPGTGLLTSAGWVPSQGRTPRFIGFDPSRRFLFGANEQSDTVVTWRADADKGRLTPTGQPVRNASPVTIAFAQWDR